MNKYYIVNCVDRPCERLVAIRNDDMLHYIHPDMLKHSAMGVRLDSTLLEDFGFDITESAEGINFRKSMPSRATYSDGSIRKWQGAMEFFIPHNNLTI